MRASRALVAGVVLAVAAGCGSDSGDDVTSKSFEEALGLDEASMQARQAKVQEAIRTCMKDQGFDYIPVDPSQSAMRISFGGPEGRDDPEFRRTKGYGITTEFGERPQPAQRSDDDPNAAIRDALSEENQEAYDVALHGADAANDFKTGGPTGGVVMRREVGGDGGDDGPTLSDMGCFGKAQQAVPGGPEELGSSLKELFERVESDPRIVQATREWATCMTKSGFDFQKPREIPDYLFGKLQELTNSAEGEVRFDPNNVDQAALSALHQEELAMAKADYDCRKESGLTKTEKEVREEAQERFLEEHPDLTAGN